MHSLKDHCSQREVTPRLAALEALACRRGWRGACAGLGWPKAAESPGPAARGRYDLTLRASLAYAVDSCPNAKENPLAFQCLGSM